MITSMIPLFFILSKVFCFTPNCAPDNQFKFYEFPVEACSDLFQDKCRFHPKGYYKALGDAPLIKIRETPVVPTCAFFKSDTILQIYGANSKIKVLASGAFMHLPNLEAIHLPFNHITEVRKDVFKNMSSKFLDLSWNKIAFIDPQAFSEIKSLNYLNLSRNVLTTVPLNTLSRSLESLNLAYNLLNRIILNSKNFVHLTHVNLSSNVINKVAISMLYPLKIIDLSDNRLKNFDYIDIQWVDMFKIGKNRFKDVPEYLENINAHEIDIYPNPWKCEKLHLVWQQLLTLNIRLVPREPSKNSSPECISKGALLFFNVSSQVREPLDCLEDHQCSSSMICRAKKCWDPCQESLCHGMSLCTTSNHEFTCSCPTGFLTDPLNIYAGCENVQCFANSHCPLNCVCMNRECVVMQFSDSANIGPAIIQEPEGQLPWWLDEIPRTFPPRRH